MGIDRSIIAGNEGYDEGSIIYRNGIKVGFLEQIPYLDDNETVLDACFNHNDDEEKIHKTNGVNISKFQEQEIRIAKRLEPLIWNPAPIERKYINLINN